jgi:hypothetical protein
MLQIPKTICYYFFFVSTTHSIMPTTTPDPVVTYPYEDKNCMNWGRVMPTTAPVRDTIGRANFGGNILILS